MLLLGTDLMGKTLGILGLGRIGQRIAVQAKNGFGMNVIYYDVIRNETYEKENAITFYKDAEDVIKRADALILSVPLLPTTHHLINAERLKMMKPSAFLINTSRGPVVDEAALVSALQNNVIRGAALDVFENEPKLAKGLSKLPNVILTPHIASATIEARDKMARLAAQNIIDFFDGKMPKSAIKA
ncbi:D-glycerate dehydrogenase, partial [Candidatus Parcubacteria bacterium]|nr:D-glycerate dehydrogenase [Candidatus Parcubacteria bacterium]